MICLMVIYSWALIDSYSGSWPEGLISLYVNRDQKKRSPAKSWLILTTGAVDQIDLHFGRARKQSRDIDRREAINRKWELVISN